MYASNKSICPECGVGGWMVIGLDGHQLVIECGGGGTAWPLCGSLMAPQLGYTQLPECLGWWSSEDQREKKDNRRGGGGCGRWQLEVQLREDNGGGGGDGRCRGWKRLFLGRDVAGKVFIIPENYAIGTLPNETKSVVGRPSSSTSV